MKNELTIQNSELISTSIEQTVFNEVMNAYSDCHKNKNYKGDRNLNFCSSFAVLPVVAEAIMAEALGGDDYNEFTPRLLQEFDCPIVLAREGSVCVYVPKETATNIPSDQAVGADEFHEETDFFRYWWD